MSTPLQPPNPFDAHHNSLLTPARCRIIFSLLLITTFAFHLYYIRYACPFNLTGDEAHYWEWSRHLALSYYSKGPAVAYIIHAATHLLGVSVFAIRLPALLFASASLILTYWLTLRLFGSDKLALGAVALNCTIPLLSAGAVLMTIDPPFYFCWAATTSLAALALLKQKRWPWPLIGLFIGLGTLAKYAMLLYLPTLLFYLLFTPSLRNILKSPWPYLAALIALAVASPIAIWNAQNNWVSFHHVAHQTGAAAHTLTLSNVADFWLVQAGLVGPLAFILLVASILWALLPYPAGARGDKRVLFLLWIGLPFFLINLADSFFSKIQGNWPAPAYFSLLILVARFIANAHSQPPRWRIWRPIVYLAAITGLAAVVVAHNSEFLYPLMQKAGVNFANTRLDPTIKFKGFDVLAQALNKERNPNTIIIADDYQTASELAYYLPDHPVVFCAGSYLPIHRDRLTQFDFWPDHALDQPALIGKDALYVGYVKPDMPDYFFGSPTSWFAQALAPPDPLHPDDKPIPIDPITHHFKLIPQKVDVVVKGITIRSFEVFHFKGFRGMIRPTDQGPY